MDHRARAVVDRADVELAADVTIHPFTVIRRDVQVARGAERVVRVTDEEVEAAMRAFFTDTHNVAEGAGAAALAALLGDRERVRGRPAAVVLCGGNVDAAVFARVQTSGRLCMVHYVPTSSWHLEGDSQF